jgi:hypothetical protein
MFVRLFAFIFALTALTISSRAGVAVGDPAPEFHPGAWVQGQPVEKLDSAHVYIVEFWATWCGPCQVSIPHLNALWEKFKDKGVIVIGQDVWDQDGGVPAFVQKMGTNMTYRVALDDKTHEANGFMADTWWKRGVEHHGIPNAFVIKNNRVAWIGHPMGLNADILDGILSDQFDFSKAAADYQTEAKKEAAWNDIQDKLNKDMDHKQWDDASADLDAWVKLDARMSDNLAMSRFKILLGQKKYAQAYQFAEQACDKHATNAAYQNAFAWSLVTEKGLAPGNLPVARKIAERANEAAHNGDPNILDTLARVQFMSGEQDFAIATEQKAIDTAEQTAQQQQQYKKTLADYQAGVLPNANP